MAINKKLIHFKSKQTFEQEVANENILDTSIVFIQDSKEISTHGTVYKTVNWSVLEPGPETKPLTFEALEDGTFSFTKNGTGDDIQYSKDNGTTWTPLVSGETVSVVTGDKVMWKSTITPNTSYPYGIGTFSSTNNFNLCGNIMSLLYGDDFKGQTSLEDKDYVFYRMFHYCTKMIDASNLILPATTLAKDCYNSMFQGCTRLTTSPELSATTLARYCYSDMFSECTSLNHITMLATNISASGCLALWVYGVASTGTFVKHPGMTSLPTGESGIPKGWTVEDAVIS